MLIRWYKISYSSLALPLIAIIGTEDGPQSTAEGWLFASNDFEDTPHEFKSLVHAEPGQHAILSEAVKTEFLMSAQDIAKRSAHGVESVELEHTHALGNSIRAWRTAGLYKSMNFAQEKSEQAEICAALKEVAGLVVTERTRSR